LLLLPKRRRRHRPLERRLLGFFQQLIGLVVRRISSVFGCHGTFIIVGDLPFLAVGMEPKTVVNDLQIVLGLGGGAGAELRFFSQCFGAFLSSNDGLPLLLGVVGRDPVRAPVLLTLAVLLIEPLLVAHVEAAALLEERLLVDLGILGGLVENAAQRV